jgi:prepilin-type N-terminal cleavage/methylation domain-containing protein
VPSGPRRAGFTLLEILLAVSLLAVATTVTYLCFATVTSAWKRGQALSYDIHHADFVMEQLEMALRSAYYRAQGASSYGFILEDDGEGAGAGDKISWVKLGSSLVGAECPFVGTPHRVKFFLQEGKGGKKEAAITAWRMRGQADDFDAEKLEPVPLSKGIAGFNCRVRDPQATAVEWLDEWEDTNKIPTAVELTLYMDPLDEHEEPVEIKRIVELPVAALAWGTTAPPRAPTGPR